MDVLLSLIHCLMFLEIAGSYYVMYCLVPFLVSTEEVNILNEFLSFSVKA